MPSWRVHREYARQFLREMGGCQCRSSDVDLIVDALIDEPQSAIQALKEKLLREDKLLALLLIEEKLRPLEPVGRHDWGAWSCRLPSVEAARRVGEIIAGRAGRLLVDLHLSLDYAWKTRDLNLFKSWSERLQISPEVVKFILSKVFCDCGG